MRIKVQMYGQEGFALHTGFKKFSYAAYSMPERSQEGVIYLDDGRIFSVMPEIQQSIGKITASFKADYFLIQRNGQLEFPIGAGGIMLGKKRLGGFGTVKCSVFLPRRMVPHLAQFFTEGKNCEIGFRDLLIPRFQICLERGLSGGKHPTEIETDARDALGLYLLQIGMRLDDFKLIWAGETENGSDC